MSGHGKGNTKRFGNLHARMSVPGYRMRMHKVYRACPVQLPCNRQRCLQIQLSSYELFTAVSKRKASGKGNFNPIQQKMFRCIANNFGPVRAKFVHHGRNAHGGNHTDLMPSLHQCARLLMHEKAVRRGICQTMDQHQDMITHRFPSNAA